LAREWIVRPDKFNALEDALKNGGIYASKPKKILGHTKKRTIYIRGINLEENAKTADLEKIL
jgi:nitrogen regulatory protein PII